MGDMLGQESQGMCWKHERGVEIYNLTEARRMALQNGSTVGASHSIAG